MRHSESVQFGNSGIFASRLGLGTAPLGGMYLSVSDEDAVDLIVTARNSGIEYFDTAPFYGNGVAERRLRLGLKAGVTPPRVVSTKVGRILVAGVEKLPGIYVDEAPEQPVFDFSEKGIRSSFEESLKRLGLDRVEVLLIHDADNHEEQALNEAYPVLEQIREEGLAGVIGIAMDYPRIPTRFVRETDIDVVLIAGRFTLLDQSAQMELLPAALKKGVSVITAGVFNSGILANPVAGTTFEYEPASSEMIAKAQAIAAVIKDFNVPMTAVALQFPLRHPAVTAVLTGARHKKELLANIADFDLTVPEECWTALEEAGLVEPLNL